MVASKLLVHLLVSLALQTVSVRSQILLFPTQYRFIYASSTSVTTADLTACQTLVLTKIPKGFFGWDSASKACTYGTAITGFIYGVDTVTPAALVSATSSATVTASANEAETHMMNEVYGSSDCPPGTTLSSGACVTTMPNKIYGVYIASRFKNGTILVLSKAQVQESLNYYCDTNMSVRMTFGGAWYCYTRFDNIGTLTYSTITSNKCASLQAGSSVIKFSDKNKECGFLTEMRNGFDVFLGLYLPTGVKKTATAYKYYDGTLPGALPWGTGYPNVTDTTKSLVICDNVQVGYVRDVTATSFKSLFCKKAATRITTTTSTTTPATTTKTTTESSTVTTTATTTSVASTTTETSTSTPTTPSTSESTTTSSTPTTTVTTTTTEPSSSTSTTTSSSTSTTPETSSTASTTVDSTSTSTSTTPSSSTTTATEPSSSTSTTTEVTTSPTSTTESTTTSTPTTSTSTTPTSSATESSTSTTSTSSSSSTTTEPSTTTPTTTEATTTSTPTSTSTASTMTATTTEQSTSTATTASTSTTATRKFSVTGSSEMLSVLACQPLSATQVGLIVDTGVAAQPGFDYPVAASCETCTSGTKKFWESTTWANPDIAAANGEKAIGVQCANICVCDEAGECFKAGAVAPTTVSFYPYCAGGVCHVYAVQSGSDDAVLTSTTTSKKYALLDQFVNDDDFTVKDMNPNLNPQVYIYAAAVSCNGCTNIQNDVCTGPAVPAPTSSTVTLATTTQTSTVTTIVTTTTALTTTVAQCVPLASTQVGLLLDSGTTTQPGTPVPAQASCPSCTTGTKNFWSTVTQPNPDDAQKAVGVQCSDMSQFCICDEEGECYKPGAVAAQTVSLYPYCVGGVCHMYAVQQGDDSSSLVGTTTSKTYTRVDQYVNDVDFAIKDMDPNLNPQVYIYAASISCSGCSDIRQATCTGPAT